MRKILLLGFIFGGIISSPTYCQFVEEPIPDRGSYRMQEDPDMESITCIQWKKDHTRTFEDIKNIVWVVEQERPVLLRNLEGYRQEKQRLTNEVIRRDAQISRKDEEIQQKEIQLTAANERTTIVENERDGAMAGVVLLHDQKEAILEQLRDAQTTGLTAQQIQALLRQHQ